MDDLISRQAAITAIQKAYADTVRGMDKCAVWKNVGLTHALHIMQDLPSVQPEIIRCKDCKYWMRAYLSISGKHGCNVMRDYTAPDDYCFKAERKA